MISSINIKTEPVHKFIEYQFRLLIFNEKIEITPPNSVCGCHEKIYIIR
jgi:hypothetical protein